MRVFLDMDGVLADFDGGLSKQGITNDVWFIHKPKEEWTPEQVELDKAVVNCMRQPGFFYNLSPCHGAFLLWDSVANLEPWILTARPNERVSGNRVTSEKFKWVEKHLGLSQAQRTIVCLRSEKIQWAVEWDHAQGESPTRIPNILVDDLLANCQAWEQAGGIAVHHQGDILQTIDKLKEAIG